MDGNLWAGTSVVKDDPKPQKHNGKFFEKFLSQNDHLTVVIALPMCSGSITRRRSTKNGIQESILDFFLVCDQMLPKITQKWIQFLDKIQRHSCQK